MKKKVISKYGYTYKGVSLDPVSITVPDQSLSVEDILRRFTQGVLSESEIVRDHLYGDDLNPDEDFDNLDPQYDSDYDLVDAFLEASNKDALEAELTASARRARGRGRKDTSTSSRGGSQQEPQAAASVISDFRESEQSETNE